MAAPAWGKAWGKAWGNAWGKLLDNAVEEIIHPIGSAGGRSFYKPTSMRLRNPEFLNYEEAEEYEVIALITAFLRIKSWHH